MKYVKTINEFENDFDYLDYRPINEGIFSSINKSVLARILAPTVTVGNDIFESINQNVDELEEAIEHYNDELKVNRKTATNKAEQLLSVDFDKTKLKLNQLIEFTSINAGSFTGDVFLSNIMNYRVFLSPIRMAKIMALGYRYYMTIIRQALQQALVSVELYADSFFTLVKDGIVGEDMKFIEAQKIATDEIINSFRGYVDRGNLNTSSGKSVKLRKEQQDALKTMLDNVNKMNSLRAKRNQGGYSGNFRQNIFQDAGRHIESLVKDDNQKELSSMAEQFSNLADKKTSGDKDTMLGTYAQSVKLSAEARANKVCSKIHINLLEILKMFSLRAQEGLASLFEGLDKREEWEKNKDSQEELIEMLKMQDKEKDKRIQDMESELNTNLERDEMSSKLKAKLDSMGFDELPNKKLYRELIRGGNETRVGIGRILIENGFSRKQADDIIDKMYKVTDFEPVGETDDNGVPEKWEYKKPRKDSNADGPGSDRPRNKKDSE